MSFASDLANYAKKTNQSIEDAVTTINLQLTRDVILKTPVDSGRARGSWQPSFGSPSSDIDKKSLDQSLNLASESAGKVFYLTNNLPYIIPLEYGWSKQAPEGFVRLSILDANNLLRKFKTTK